MGGKRRKKKEIRRERREKEIKQRNKIFEI